MSSLSPLSMYPSMHSWQQLGSDTSKEHYDAVTFASTSSTTLVEDEVPFSLTPDTKTLVSGSGLLDAEDTAEHTTLTHPAWLHQFAEKARQAYLRNVQRPPLPSPLSSSTFNPAATPFIPAAVRAHAAATVAVAPGPICLELMEERPLQLRHPWMTAFRRGCVTSDRKVRRVQAMQLVSYGPWDASTMADLAAKFSNRVAEGYGPELAIVAPFARDVYDAFASELGELNAVEFRDHLRDYGLAEFLAWWKVDWPTALANVCSERQSRAQTFLSSALAVATFIADLFVQQLVPADYVRHCLGILAERLVVIEQVHAMHAIVLHADERLYDARTMPLFVDALRLGAAAIPDNASVVGQWFDQGQVQSYVQEICDIVCEWTRGGPSTPPSAPSSEDDDWDDAHEACTPVVPHRRRGQSPTMISTGDSPTIQFGIPPISYRDVVKHRV